MQMKQSEKKNKTRKSMHSIHVWHLPTLLQWAAEAGDAS